MLSVTSRILEKELLPIPYVQLENKAPNYFMVQKDLGVQGDYEKGFNVSKLMALNAVGIVTARDSFTIHHTKQQVKDTITKFLNMENEEARKYFELGKDVRDWQVGFAKKDLEDFPNGGEYTQINYRLFDKRWSFYTGNSKGFYCYPRYDVMKHFLKTKNVGLALCKQFKSGDNYQHIFITDLMIESSYVSNKTSEITSLFPLYLYPEITNQENFDFNQLKNLRKPYYLS